MRTFDRTRRITLDFLQAETMFYTELEYYRNNNQHPVVLFGKKIINIYKNINVQVVISRGCNAKCQFCIERDDLTICRELESPPTFLLDEVLSQYKEQGIVPCVSITGGEPTMFPKMLNETLGVLKKHGIEKANINTNGSNLSAYPNLGNIRVNLSRHHHNDEISHFIFGRNIPLPPLNENIFMQCVLIDGVIDTVAKMKEYMDFFIAKGVGGFSFRGLSKLDVGKRYIHGETSFSNDRRIDLFGIANQVFQDSDFEFVQQKIGDHYWYEVYKYKGKPVRLTYSDFYYLSEVEQRERGDGQWFSRATIVSPFGKVFAGWTYDINQIYNIASLRENPNNVINLKVVETNVFNMPVVEAQPAEPH